jgi:Sel1 repeat
MITAPIVTFEMRHPSTVGAPLALLTPPLGELTPDEAREAYRRVRGAADGGSAFAMCLCANWPDVHGQGKVTDSDRYQWSERAARTGYPPGLFELAVCFEKGIGVPADMGSAQKLYKLSSDGGFGFATHRLAKAYIDGDFGTRDAALAVHLMERSYEEGEALAALALGEWFESGERVPRNVGAAVSWYERASQGGDFFATYRLHVAYSQGELGLPRDGIMAKKYQTLIGEQTKIKRPYISPGT